MSKKKSSKKIRKSPAGAVRSQSSRNYVVRLGEYEIYKTDDILRYDQFQLGLRNYLEAFGVQYSTYAMEEKGQGVFTITIRNNIGL